MPIPLAQSCPRCGEPCELVPINPRAFALVDEGFTDLAPWERAVSGRHACTASRIHPHKRKDVRV